MKLIDLFCGRGGWTKGFMAAGWDCVGYDLFPQPDYPGTFVQRDVLTMTADDLKDADFITCSSPCEQFACWGMRHFHPNPAYPEMGMELFNHARSILDASGKPYVMENVRAAQQFVGPATSHAGSFYLWGNAAPALIPIQAFRKGATQKRRDGRYGSANAKVDELMYADRKVRAALLAEIPMELSSFIAGVAEAIIRGKNGNS
jgi:hypothetical protein